MLKAVPRLSAAERRIEHHVAEKLGLLIELPEITGINASSDQTPGTTSMNISIEGERNVSLTSTPLRCQDGAFTRWSILPEDDGSRDYIHNYFSNAKHIHRNIHGRKRGWPP